MLSGTCAFCGNKTHFTAKTGRRFNLERRDPANQVERSQSSVFYRCRLSVAATCDACHAFNVATGNLTWRSKMPALGDTAGGDLTTEAEQMTDITWSPPAMIKADTEFLPEGVGGYLQEAHDAYSIAAYRGVLLLVRSVIEATARDRGITDGTLVQKINKLDEGGHIRRGTRDMAHALRILGNDAAHGEIDEIPSQEDADDALTIVRFVLDDVYVADARRADIMQRRSKAPATEQ